MPDQSPVPRQPNGDNVSGKFRRPDSVAVIIPTFNRHDQLRACLTALDIGRRSVTDIPLQIIVTDDGTDSAEQALGAEFPWVDWTVGPRRGPAANRNHGIAQSSGALLLLTDDDCIPDPNWLSALILASQQFPDVDVFEGITDAERPQRSLAEESPRNLVGGMYWTCNLAIRRSAFEKLGGFDPGFPFAAYEDIDFSTRFKAAGVQAMFVPEARICHPWREHGSWRSWKRQHASLRYFMRKHPDQSNLESPFFWFKGSIKGLITIPVLWWRYGGRGWWHPVQAIMFNIWMTLSCLRSLMTRQRV